MRFKGVVAFAVDDARPLHMINGIPCPAADFGVIGKYHGGAAFQRIKGSIFRVVHHHGAKLFSGDGRVRGKDAVAHAVYHAVGISPVDVGFCPMAAAIAKIGIIVVKFVVITAHAGKDRGDLGAGDAFVGSERV